MYKSLARTWLEILDVRAERIQDISEEDAIAEGCKGSAYSSIIDDPEALNGWRNTLTTSRIQFMKLWNSIHGPDAWKDNKWVWAYKFRRCEKPED